MVLTPTYHVFKMYVPFQDATLRAGHLRRRHLHARRHHAAARRRDRGQGRGRHAVARVTNVDPTTPADIAATLAGITRAVGRGETLTAPKVDSVNTFEAPNTVAPKPVARRSSSGNRLALTLAPKSVTGGIAVPANDVGMRVGARTLLWTVACPAGDAAAQVQTDVPPPVAGAKPVTVERIKVHGARARRQSRRRRRRPRRHRLPAAELRDGQDAALSGRLRAARLLHRRRAVDAGDPRAADDRGRVRAGRARDDRRAARLEDARTTARCTRARSPPATSSTSSRTISSPTSTPTTGRCPTARAAASSAIRWAATARRASA